MHLAFVQKFEAVARRAQRQRWATALCWAFAFIAAALLALIALDWLLGVYSLPGRLLLSALLVASLATVFAWSRQATRGRVQPLDIAVELQRNHPQYESLLASGLEFSDQEGDDPTAGSTELRRAVVLRASLAADAIDLQSAVPRKPFRQAALAALAAALTLAIPAVMAPHGVATGVTRLFNPLSDAQWPREHDLAFATLPKLTPIGADFRTMLRDRQGKLPTTVEVEFRMRNQGRWQYHSQTYAASGDAIEVVWPNVQQSFEFRARGGDHKSMTWHRVEAAPAPQIQSLDTVVQPPAYTRLPAEPATPPLRILAGSQVTLRGSANLPLKSAMLEAAGQGAMPLTISSDGRAIRTSAPWKPAESAEWSFVVSTPEGLIATADRRLTVEVVPDEPPIVELTASREELHVVPTAVIEVAAAARDDQAIASLSLALASPAYDGNMATAAELRNVQPEPGTREFEISEVYNLSEAKPAVGSTWQVTATARDSAGQVVVSPRNVVLRIISPEEFIRRQDALQARLVAALQRAYELQRLARESSAPPAAATPQIAAVLAPQRAVAAAINSGSESAAQLADALAAEQRRNSPSESASRTDAERWRAEIHAVADGPLATLESQLATLARGGDRRSDAAAAGVSDAVTAIQAEQDQVLAELERLIRELSSRSEVQRHQRTLSQLKSEQSALQRETEAVAGDELRNPDKELTRQERRRREQIAAAQRALAARLATAVADLRASAQSLAAQRSGEAEGLAKAATQAEQSPLQSASRHAAEDMAEKRFGQAAQNQRQTSEQLQKVINELEKVPRGVPSDQPPAGAAKTLQSKKLIEQLDAALTKLVAAQKSVTGRITHPEPAPDAQMQLAREQAAVREQSTAQSDQIAELPVFAHALHSAARTMGQVEVRLQKESAASEAAPLATQALEQLERLAAAVRQQREQQAQPPKPNPAPNPNAKSPQPPPPPPNPDAVQALQVVVAQLGLLRTMQAALQEQTAELEKAHAAERIDDAALAEQSAELAAEQQTLNELAAELVKAVTQPLPKEE